jgi:hypothetical protein
MDVPVPVAYDLSSHHALGGGSYAFETGYPAYLKALLLKPNHRTEVNVIIQPNSTPYIGTLCCLGLIFIIARRLVDEGRVGRFCYMRFMGPCERRTNQD